jgi:uncharacterized protein YbjT (DUF2867 family)
LAHRERDRDLYMQVLVTGASGFAGSLLVPRLLDAGHRVRALGRDPARVRSALAHTLDGRDLSVVEIIRGDTLADQGLKSAMREVEVAYYLIHSMERSSSALGAFGDRERSSAENFAFRAARAGVRRVVYLGGLVPREVAPGGTNNGARALSRHLGSRLAVERILADAAPEFVALRASIVIGARSRSFRLLVHLVERMRVLALPAWRRFRTQPIDERDVTDMLAAASTANVAGASLDVGGPEVLSYGEMITRIAELMLVHRPAVGLGVSLTPFTARLAAAIGGEEPELVLPLMGSLRGDLLIADERAARELKVSLHSFDSAVEHALREWEEYEPLAAR